MALRIPEVFPHGTRGIGSNVLHRSGFGSRGRHDDGVVHGAVVIEDLDHLRNRGALLSNGTVNTNQIAALVVDDGIESDRRLTRLPVTDDEFALPTTNGDHAVNGFESCGHWFAHRLAIDNPGSQTFEGNVVGTRDYSLVVDGMAERVDHATDECISHGHAHNSPGALHFIALFDFRIVAE